MRCRACVCEFVALLGWLMLPLIVGPMRLPTDATINWLLTLTCGVGKRYRVCVFEFPGLKPSWKRVATTLEAFTLVVFADDGNG